MTQLPLIRNAPQKQPKGTSAKRLRALKRQRKARERSVMNETKARDNWRCRFNCTVAGADRVQCAHRDHRGMGGDPKGDRTQRHLMVTACAKHHRAWDNGRVDLVPRTAAEFDGPCDFYEQDRATRMFVHVATEVSKGDWKPVSSLGK